jgi:predicted Rossmann fold nucleotide-binding protein DprA/Smf involved in DNA uptake
MYEINKIQITDNNYPYKLKYINSKPKIIYFLWDINLLNDKIIWIVWPRNMTGYCKDIMDCLFKYLKNYKIITVSWLANWVDSYCHELSVKYNIPTVAVLGWWLWFFIKSKKLIINNIINNWWLVMSEFDINKNPETYMFPYRNRIIAWLSDFLFLPEAWEKSWSLITVDFALKMAKRVYWCMNSIFMESGLWVNKYISQWKIIWVYDIRLFLEQELGRLDLSFDKNISYEWLSDIEIDILDCIKDIWELDIDILSNKIWKSINDIMVWLSMLEIKWLIKEIRSWTYKLVLNL